MVNSPFAVLDGYLINFGKGSRDLRAETFHGRIQARPFPVLPAGQLVFDILIVVQELSLFSIVHALEVIDDVIQRNLDGIAARGEGVVCQYVSPLADGVQ